MPRKNTLQPEDWTWAAMRALADGGIDAVSVEGIAKTLGASKGSFYWHFADRPALLVAVFDLWERDGTADLIDRAKLAGDPVEGLRGLARDALDAETHGIDVARTESAIRAWASHDPYIGERFSRVEEARTAFLANQIGSLGYDGATAMLLSKVMHLALIGLFAARASSSSLAEDETYNFLVEDLIARAPRPQSRKKLKT